MSERPILRALLWIVGLVGGGLVVAFAVLGLSPGTSVAPTAVADAVPVRTPSGPTNGAPPQPNPLPTRGSTPPPLPSKQQRPVAASAATKHVVAKKGSVAKTHSPTKHPVAAKHPAKKHPAVKHSVAAKHPGKKHQGAEKHSATKHPVAKKHASAASHAPATQNHETKASHRTVGNVVHSVVAAVTPRHHATNTAPHPVTTPARTERSSTSSMTTRHREAARHISHPAASTAHKTVHGRSTLSTAKGTAHGSVAKAHPAQTKATHHVVASSAGSHVRITAGDARKNQSVKTSSAHASGKSSKKAGCSGAGRSGAHKSSGAGHGGKAGAKSSSKSSHLKA